MMEQQGDRACMHHREGTNKQWQGGSMMMTRWGDNNDMGTGPPTTAASPWSQGVCAVFW